MNVHELYKKEHDFTELICLVAKIFSIETISNHYHYIDAPILRSIKNFTIIIIFLMPL